MTNLGILVSDLSHNQLTFSLVNASTHTDMDFSVFYENPFPPVYHYSFPTMNMINAYNHNGTLIATSASTAKKLIDFPISRKKYMYVWDLEWGEEYSVSKEIYQSINLIARSESHKTVIEDMWNVKVVAVVPDFSFKGLGEVIYGTN